MKKTDYIEIKGAKVNNLKNIDVKIPRNKLVVIAGVSGSVSRPWPSNISMPRDNVAMSRVCPVMPDSFLAA
jgi:hypothetical protein